MDRVCGAQRLEPEERLYRALSFISALRSLFTLKRASRFMVNVVLLFDICPVSRGTKPGNIAI